MKRIILKISGEALAYSDSKGIDHQKVKNIAQEIKDLYDQGGLELGIVIGAGNIWRERDAQLSGMERSSADYTAYLS